jgi:hypothetical protein
MYKAVCNRRAEGLLLTALPHFEDVPRSLEDTGGGGNVPHDIVTRKTIRMTKGKSSFKTRAGRVSQRLKV